MNGKEAELVERSSTGHSSRWMALALVLSAIFFAFQFILPQTVGEQIRRHVLEVVREHYPDHEITIANGRLDPKVGLVFDDIRVRAASAGEPKKLFRRPMRDLLRIERLIVVTQTQIQRVLEQENPFVAKRIIVNGLRASLWEEPDGTVSLQSLLPPPKFGDSKTPRVEFRNAVVSFFEKESNHPLEVTIQKALVLESSDADGPKLTVAASGGSSFAESIKLHFDQTSDVTEVSATIGQARFSRELVASLPQRLRSMGELAGDLELLCDAGIRLRMKKGQPIEFAAQTTVHDGTFRHPDFSLPIKQIRGVLYCDRHGAAIKTCRASWGEADIHVASKTLSGYSWPLDASFEISAQNLTLDQRLAETLPKQLRNVWQKFEPNGVVDIVDGTINLIEGKAETSADVICKGVDINFVGFPYPVESLTGTFSLKDGRVQSRQMTGWLGGRAMTCMFDVPAAPDPKSEQYFSATMDGPIAINAELFHALTPRGAPITQLEAFFRSLHPLGAIHLEQATLRTDAAGIKHQSATLVVSDGTLRYEKFPYPLYNVGGKVRVEDGVITLSEFQGSNANGGSITCDGVFRTPNRSRRQSTAQREASFQPMLDLNFTANRVALDESLRSSLPPTSQKTWDSLWPSGVLDSLDIDLRIPAPGESLDLAIDARQFESGKLNNDTLRIQPASVPYRMDIVEGSVRFRDGQVLIDSLRATHGLSEVSAEGGCEPTNDGRWLLTLDLHSGSRLIPDAELINSLPVEMRGAMRGLNLRGPIRLRGLTKTLLSSPDFPQPIFVWDLDLQLEGNRIGDVGPVRALRGELSVKGEKDARGLRAQGDIRLDSMHVRDLQITGIRGPYQIRDDQLLLGQSVAPNDPNVSPINGRLFDGSFGLNGIVKLSDASFDVRMGLSDAKVPVLLAEVGQGKSSLTGTLDAQVALEGLLGTTELLSGRGQATVENANLYELPILYQLLNVLSVTPGEEVAFTNGDVDFTLVEDQVVFNDLKLWGSLIALRGTGTLDRRQQLDLMLNTQVSPRNNFRRLFRPLSNREFTFWTLDVRGPISDPVIERSALHRRYRCDLISGHVAGVGPGDH